ncbi:MAG: oligosaccharide flippase family protein, partial [Limisphaerales bacterium]
MAAKAVSVITNLITIPLTLHYLGSEQYGVWVAITSIFLILGVADFGIGNGLLNMIAFANGRDDPESVRKHISTAFCLFSIIGLSIALIAFAASPFVSFRSLLNITAADPGNEIDRAALTLFILFAINLPFTTVLRLQEGLQEGFNNYIIQIAGNVLSLILIVLTIKLEQGLPALVFSLLAGPFFATFLNFCLQFGALKKWARPSFASIDKSSAKTLLSSG